MAVKKMILGATLTWAAVSQVVDPIDQWWAGMAVGPLGEARRLSSMKFSGIPVPAGDDKKVPQMSKEVRVLEKSVLKAANDQENYQMIVEAGEAWRAKHPYEGDTFGVIMEKGTGSVPVYELDSTDPTKTKSSTVMVSDDPDFASLIHQGGKTYMFVHLENTPGGTYFLELEQNPTTGALTLEKSKFVDWSRDGGMWIPCAGSLSPWNTHLGAEEYEPEAKAWSNVVTASGQAGEWMRYHGSYPSSTNQSGWIASFNANFFPYQLGYCFELAPDASSANGYRAEKRMAMGRRSGELPFVLPDLKTVYMTDDGGNTYLSMFVTTKAGDLTAGELFCAKATQTSAVNGGSFTIEWISMGVASEAPLRAASTTTSFADLFEVATPTKTTFPAECPTDFKPVHGSAGLECLKLKAGQETLASRFESRRYASYMGCTTEWNKMEGFTYSVDSGKAYVVMSTVQGGMEDRADKGAAKDTKDAGTGNHVRVPYNMCGCVYELTLNAAYRATSMAGLVCGVQGDGSDPLNPCNTSFISNPDNVAAVQGHAALLIAEDTGNHENNIMWKYDLDTGMLEERIAATPLGAEVCSPYFYPDVGGFSYLMMIVQHPDSALAGKAGVGYAVWKRECSATYPAWAMPGDGAASRCAKDISGAKDISDAFQACPVAAALLALAAWVSAV